MSSGAEHYKRAEKLLDEVDGIDPLAFASPADFLAARTSTVLGAQVHATLALAAAAADDLCRWEVSETGAGGLTEWGKALSKDAE